MTKNQIIHAWKDEEYRLSLSDAEIAKLPENPAGAVEISEVNLEMIAGGAAPTGWICLTIGVSAAISCVPSCNASVWDGTCNVASVGCCPA